MFSVTKYGSAAAILMFSLALPCHAAVGPVLRVCADPGNLPYSNRQQQGFENKLAGMISADLGMNPDYTWFPQRGAFFRKTLDARVCDVVMGVPVGMSGVDVTHPYYRSDYVFVSLAGHNLNLHSLNDPRLRNLRIAVQNLGDSDRSIPPVQALTMLGIAAHFVGYNIFGNLDEENPAADPIRAVESGKADVAVAWGPIAGYFARDSKMPLRLDAIAPDAANPSLPLAFDIGIGLRPDEADLKRRLNAELDKRKPEIDKLLRTYGIPGETGAR